MTFICALVFPFFRACLETHWVRVCGIGPDMSERRIRAYCKCSFAVNGFKYHGNVSYWCYRANGSLAKYVTSQMIVAGNEKLDWTRLDILDACRNSARVLSPLDQIRGVPRRSSSSDTQSFLMSKSPQEAFVPPTHSPYALMQHIR
jgi:hypothetical protein